MSEFWMLLLMQVTIFSSVTACIIICVKQLFKWVIPPSVGVIMWAILLVRLLWPIFPESPVSVYNYIPAGRSIMYTLTNDIDDELSARERLYAEQSNPYVVNNSIEYSSTDRVGNASSHLYPGEETPLTVGEYLADAVYAGKTKSENALVAREVNVVLLSVYAFGAAVALTLNLLVYAKAKRKALKTSLQCTDERVLAIYRSTAKKIGIKNRRIPPLKYGVASMLVGCISPTVIYKESERVSDRELSMIFAHELNHFKHRDNYVLVFSTVVTSLFWFNPLIWIVRNMLREDIEVMCDARTISLGEVRRTEYAEMIYNSSDRENRMAFAGCRMSASSRRLKNRLRTIARNLEDKLLPRIASSVLCVFIIIVCLTNPIVSQNIEYKDYIGNYSRLTGDSEQTMHLTSTVSVSYYIKQVCTIINQNFSDSVSQKIGNGSLENLKRIVERDDNISRDIAEKIGDLRADQPLTLENCTLLNKCMVVILSGGAHDDSATIPLIPKYISVAKMEELARILPQQELNILLKCYNRGVEGAVVKLEAYYTEAMFELILSRLDDKESQDMWSSFYTKVDLKTDDISAICERLSLDEDTLAEEDWLYVVTPSLTMQEKKILHGIIKSAHAGQNESVYYLKENVGGYSEFALHRIISKAGYTFEDIISDYARMGTPQYEYFTARNSKYLTQTQYEVMDIRLEGSGISASEFYTNLEGTDFYVLTNSKSAEFIDVINYLNEMAFINVRDWDEDGVSLKGIVSQDIKDAVIEMYSLGLIDATNGEIDLSDPLSCGQSLYYSYKLVCSIVNANR